MTKRSETTKEPRYTVGRRREGPARALSLTPRRSLCRYGRTGHCTSGTA